MPLAAQGQRDEGDGGRGRGREEVQRQRKGGSWGRRGGFKPEFSPWRHTGSPEIRGVINLSVEPANPIAPWPGNLASSGGGRAEASKGTLTGGTERRKRERDEGGKICFIKSHLSFNKPWCWTGDEA